MLIDTIVATMRSEGSVLLPCDTAGRVFELALLLDDYWQHTVRFRVQLVYLRIAMCGYFCASNVSVMWCITYLH